MDESAKGSDPFTIERRQNTRLRSIFPDASMRVAHVFHGQTSWVDSSIDYLAKRVVHEAYPDLSGAEIRTLISAIGQHVQSSAHT